jgi:hypothetical protein
MQTSWRRRKEESVIFRHYEEDKGRVTLFETRIDKFSNQ